MRDWWYYFPISLIQGSAAAVVAVGIILRDAKVLVAPSELSTYGWSLAPFGTLLYCLAGVVLAAFRIPLAVLLRSIEGASLALDATIIIPNDCAV